MTIETRLGRAAVMVAAMGAAGTAWGQMAAPKPTAAPRYQGPLASAPQPQLQLPPLPVPAPRSSPDATVIEDIVVRVNDQVISRSDVERQRQLLLDDVQRGKLSQADLPAAERDLLRDMISDQLLLSRAKELDLGTQVDSEVIRQMDEIRKQNHLDAMEQKDCTAPGCTSLERAVRESGITYEDFRANMKNQIMRQTVEREEVAKNIHRPTQRDEQAFYEAHQADLMQPEQVALSEILIPTEAEATQAQLDLAKAKADEVMAKLKAGTSFEDVARQYSGGPNADKGGELGTFPKGKMGKLLDDATFVLKAGEWTQPIRTRQGYVVLKVTAHTPAGVPPMKDVEDQLQDAMFRTAMQPALEKYLLDLREKAYIDIAPGFVDTGASPNETKPMFASATPLPVKKKSAVEKSRLAATAAQAAEQNAAAAPTETATARPADALPATAGSAAASAGTASAAAVGSATKATAKAATVKVAKDGKPGKPQKIHREKIRYGQAPENALPAGTVKTAEPGSVDAATPAIGSSLTAGPQAGSISTLTASNTNVDPDTDLLAPEASDAKKTRFTDRQATEKQRKAVERVAKVKQKAIDKPVELSADEKLNEQQRNAALGLNGDTAKKKKKVKAADAPKERLQDKAPEPPKPAPVATPIPPKTVRDNGESMASPAPDLSGVSPAAPAAAPQQ